MNNHISIIFAQKNRIAFKLFFEDDLQWSFQSILHHVSGKVHYYDISGSDY